MAIARIVVVDDEPIVLTATSRLLQSIGFDVMSATSALEALELLADNGADIDAIVTDVNMPGMNGLELAQQVSTKWGHVGVLLVSGRESESDVMSTLPTHYKYLRKPYGIAKLKAALELALAH